MFCEIILILIIIIVLLTANWITRLNPIRNDTYDSLVLQVIGLQALQKEFSQQVPLWTVEDVIECVKKNNFKKYEKEFRGKLVDGNLLLQVYRKSLMEDIRITNSILHKKYLHDLNQLKCIADKSSNDTSSLGTLLRSMGAVFSQYTHQLLQDGIDKRNILNVTERQLLEECGITNSIHRKGLMKVLKIINSQHSELKDAKRVDSRSVDAFISYRRSNGSELASLVNVHLRNQSLNVFLDVECLEEGKFSEQLMRNVQASKNFLLILTANALDRCMGDIECKDWVHKEIAEALRSECNIIPILHPHFQWPEPESLPEDIRKICYFNGIRWNHDYQHACVTKLLGFMKEGEINFRGGS